MKLYLFIRIIIIYGCERLRHSSSCGWVWGGIVATGQPAPPAPPLQIFHDIMRYYLYVYISFLFFFSLLSKYLLMYISLWVARPGQTEAGKKNCSFLCIQLKRADKGNFTCGWHKIDCHRLHIYVKNIVDTRQQLLMAVATWQGGLLAKKNSIKRAKFFSRPAVGGWHECCCCCCRCGCCCLLVSHPTTQPPT